jgi:nucleoside-diphosphate-sugar epimerase
LVLGDDDADRVTLVRGDITDLEALERAIDDHAITRVVHLAALQVPFVRANPPLGMRVNVAGTVNVFEAVSSRLDRIPAVVYASSSAVYSGSDPSPAPESGGTTPGTLYGVSKLADEGMARVYAADKGLPSIGLRPYVVYGPGRDQGMTSGPTMAMLAAARGQPYAIGYSGTAEYDYAPDVARAFVMAAGVEREGAAVYNAPGVAAAMEDVVAAITAVVPDAEITWGGDPLPFPPELEAIGFDRDVGPFPRTPLEAGVAATIEHFRAAA